MAELLNKQQLFVKEYPKDLNATQAAIRAGYSKKTAGSQGFDLLKKPEIQEALVLELESRAERAGIDAVWVLKRLAEEATADVLDIFDGNDKLRPVREWPLIWRQGLVSGVEVESLFDGKGKEKIYLGTVTKVRLSDRIKRLELIGKHVNIQAFSDRVKHEGSINHTHEAIPVQELRRLLGEAIALGPGEVQGDGDGSDAERPVLPH